MHRIKTIIRISLQDYVHERLLSACAVLGLAAVLAPLLVIFGVKNGIITTLSERLLRNPRNLEISPVGSGHYEADFFARLARMSEVAFVIPQTRTIAANMVLVNAAPAVPSTLAVDLIPTGEGDPLLEKFTRVPESPKAIVLSASAARKLNIEAGQSVTGVVGRTVEGRKEQVTIALNVVGILPAEAVSQDAAFVRLNLLQATEDYRDGFGGEAFGWPGKPRSQSSESYPSFRLYAKGIYDVAPLEQKLQEQHVEVYTRAAEIAVVQNLDRSFTFIFRLIAVVAVCGYFASMASNVLATVNRKRRHLGVVRLIGFSTRDIVWFPVVQAAATAILGAMVAFLLYGTTELTINNVFARYLLEGEYVCRIGVSHYLAAFLMTLGLALLSSAFAGVRSAKIEPSKVIRDV